MVIENESQLREALDEIQRIWDDAKPGMKEWERFDELAKAIDVYESVHYPILATFHRERLNPG